MKHIKEILFLAIIASILSACGGSIEGGDPIVVDTTAPTFLNGDPDGTVAGACSVTAQFNEPILASTITDQSFIIKGNNATTPLSSSVGTWGLSSSSNTLALFVPLDPPATLVDDTYTVTLTTAISDVAGINLETEQNWTFTITASASVVCPPS